MHFQVSGAIAECACFAGAEKQWERDQPRRIGNLFNFHAGW